MKEPREYFEDKFDAQLQAFEEDLGELEFRVENMGWESGMENRREIMELRLRLDSLRKKVQELKAANDCSWQLRKEDMEMALAEFDSSLKSLILRWEEVLPG